jgi:hypothetical protein
METREKVMERLMELCKCSLTIRVNEHRRDYMDVKEMLAELDGMECPAEVGVNIRNEMIRTDSFISIRAYTDTPVGFYEVYHYDLGEAIKDMIELIEG